MELVLQDSFPKEFRRQLTQSLDRDLLVILVATAFFMNSMLLFFLRHLPAEVRPETAQKFQKQYATMILNRESRSAAVQPDRMAEVPALERRMAAAESGGATATADMGRARIGAGSGAEARLPSTADMAHAGRGRSGGYYGGGSMTSMEGEMKDVGILGVLTSGSGYVSGDYVAGLESAAGAESRRLEEVLAGLDGVKIGQYVVGRRNGNGDRSNEPLGERTMAGGRRESRALSVDDLLGSLQPTAAVEFKSTDRNDQFERSSDTIQEKPLPPGTAAEKAKLTRNAEQVQAIINSHRPAIIDCYKQLLRTQPSVKGKVEVRFAIDPDGHVLWAEVVDSTITDQAMLACLLQRIRQWNDFGYGDPSVASQVFRQSFTFGY